MMDTDQYWRERLAARQKLLQLEKPSAAEIREFCHTCDHLNDDGVCPLKFAVSSPMQSLMFDRPPGWTDQERYVHRKWCGYASIDRKRGEMTADGFVARAKA